MSKHEDDILQIKKYLAGKLDARAMYELERRAQDDPFLQDALEGYENAAKPQDENLKELSQRLKNRITEKRDRIIPMRLIAIAAGVLLFLFAGLFWLINNKHQSSTQKQFVKTAIPQEKKTIDTIPTVTTKKPDLVVMNKLAPSIHRRYKPVSKTEAEQSSKSDVATNTSPALANAESKLAYNAPVYKSTASPNKDKDSSPLNEVVVMGYATSKKRDVTASVAAISMDTLKSKAIKGLVRDANGPLAGALVSIEGTTINTTTDKDGHFKVNAVPNSSVLDITYNGYSSKQVRIKKQDSLLVSMQPFNNVLSGKVAGLSLRIAGKPVTGVVKDGNEPIPGATVKVKGTNIVTQTNINGKFTLPPLPINSKVDIVFIGYKNKEVTVQSPDSLVIAMQPNNNSLNEVVIADYDPNYDTRNKQDQSARPANGWSEFRKYIKENAESPDGKTGVVKVSFVVNADNSLSDFKVIKGVSAQTDSAAVELIRNGPNWRRNTDNKPETVKVRVKFEKKKQ